MVKIYGIDSCTAQQIWSTDLWANNNDIYIGDILVVSPYRIINTSMDNSLRFVLAINTLPNTALMT